MHVDDLPHRLAIGKFDVVEEAAAQESVGQFLLVVRRDDDDRTFFRCDGLVRFVDIEAHSIEFLQQIVGEFDIGLIDLVDQKDGQLFAGERFPQFALLDVPYIALLPVLIFLRISRPNFTFPIGVYSP